MSASRATGLWLRLGGSVVLAAFFLIALAPYFDAVPSSFAIAWWTVPSFLGVLVIYNVTRSARWLLLLRPLGDVPTSVGMRVGLAGAMWIALLPFRLGEFARPLMIARTTDVTMRRALGSIAIERVVDGLVICGLFFATASSGSGGEMSRLYAATTVVMALFGLALVTLALMGRFPAAARSLVNATVGRIAPRIAPAVAETAEAVSEGLAALPRGGPLIGFLAVTAVYWSANAFGMWVLAQGCGLSLSFTATVTVMAVINIALLVPGGPAQVGIFHAGVVLGLGLFIPPSEVKAAGSTFVFLLYVCQLGSIVAFGVWAQRSLSLGWRSVLGRPPAPAEHTDTTSTRSDT
ncbi:MAG: flippase-like domain-containing protein, partial [Nannocystaceae bacterium]|nr:flippase-like domain-containing protein [Nannocystaceae bacterium]